MGFSELGEMLRTTIVLGNIGTKVPIDLIVFGKCFSFVTVSSAFLTYFINEILFNLLIFFLAASKEIMISLMHHKMF